MDREIILGNAPFCGDSSARCGVTPGYRAVDKFKGSGFSKCWTGHKARCRFDLDTFKDTAIYRRLKEQNGTLGLNNNFFPQYKWFGTAPFCAPNKGDLAKEGYVYVKSDRCGDGRCCATGEKMLGMKPETAEQREELEREIKNYEEQQRVKDAFIDKAITGMKIIGDFGSKYGGYIPGVGTYVKAVGDGVSTLAGLMQKDKPKDDSNKVSGYNDSFINPNSLNKELKDLAEGGKLSKFAFSDPEYVKRYSILKDAYERLLNKDPRSEEDESTVEQLRKVLDYIADNESFKKIMHPDVNKDELDTKNKTMKQMVSEIQKNAYVKGYLTNRAKEYYKYKNFELPMPTGGI